MAWVQIICKRLGRGVWAGYGAGWEDVPCVAVTKSGLTFNEQCVEIFGLQAVRQVDIHYDPDRRCIGIKKVIDSDGGRGSFTVGGPSKAQKQKENRRNTRHITSKDLVAKISDCMGRAFRAHLNQSSRFIEVDLSPDNMSK